jgi:hypothetical protein
VAWSWTRRPEEGEGSPGDARARGGAVLNLGVRVGERVGETRGRVRAAFVGVRGPGNSTDTETCLLHHPFRLRLFFFFLHAKTHSNAVVTL